MIPVYPAFKRLELGDYTEVSAITRRFAPYSDFNFVSLWCWNVHDEVRISTLHGNLVVRFADYVTREPFYSFLGDQRVTETAEELLRRSVAEGLPERLRLVPDTSVHRIDSARVAVEQDADLSDYIYSTNRLRRMEGSELEDKRYKANLFARRYPNHSVERLDLANRGTTTAMVGLFEAWMRNKGYPSVYECIEFEAFKRLIEHADYFPDLMAFGVFVGSQFAAFAVLEFVHRKHCMGHYLKANITEFKGVYPFMMRQVGEAMAERSYEYVNAQQDLGLPGLRLNKGSYIPAAFLWKYSMSRAEPQQLRPEAIRPSMFSIPAPHRGLITGTFDTPGLSLSPPTISSDLLDLVAAVQEVDDVRQSGIRVAADADDSASHDEEPPNSATG